MKNDEITFFKGGVPSGFANISKKILDYKFEAWGKGTCHMLGGGFNKDTLENRCKEEAKSQAIEMAKKMGANIVGLSRETTGDVYTTNKDTGHHWYEIAYIAEFRACLYFCEKLANPKQ